uniref:Putative restriction endonuclease domain-containing protein n=1 Tax=Cyanothece sp. (strain PCC 7425 / ATCC 29141) TaxID=395961 RepID=B8HRP5_CYAP4
MSSPPLLTVPLDRLQLAPGSRVTIPDISWEQYEQLLERTGDHRSYRLSYDHGTLEIVMPSEAHEVLIRLMDWMISTLCEELALNLKTIGSTTLKAASLSTSPEPDNGYYIQNEPLVRGKVVDLSADPPPDLVVEINISNTDSNKKAIYQTLNVPEFWTYSGKTGQLSFYVLQSNQYQWVNASPTFAIVQSTTLKNLVEACKKSGELVAKQQFRRWVKAQIRK